MKPSEILFRAADLIEPEGRWIQHNFADGYGFCMAGAIFNAARGHSAAEEEYMRDIVRDVIGEPGIGDWNDAPERKQSEVVAALRNAASLAKEREAAQ